MQLEAVYRKGRLEFVAPVRFARDQFRVRVEVPEDALAPEGAGAEEADAGGDEWLARLAAIKERVLRLPPNALPPLSEKQEARARALELREDR